MKRGGGGGGGGANVDPNNGNPDVGKLPYPEVAGDSTGLGLRV